MKKDIFRFSNVVSTLFIVTFIILIISIVYSLNVNEALLNEKQANESLHMNLEVLRDTEDILERQNKSMQSNIISLQDQIEDLELVVLTNELNYIDIIKDFDQESLRPIERFFYLGNIYSDEVINRINNILDKVNLYEPGIKLEFYICKNKNIYVIGDNFVRMNNDHYYIDDDKDTIFNSSTIIIKIEDELLEITGDDIRSYNFSDDDYELTNNVLFSGIMYYTPIVPLAPYYNNYIPIIYNDVYVGGVQDIEIEYLGHNTGLFFNSQVRLSGLRNDKVQLPRLKGGEKVQVIVKGELLEEKVLPVPYFKADNAKYVTVEGLSSKVCKFI